MMRKVLLMTIVACLALTGCGKKNDDKKEGGAGGSANLIAPENADSYLLTLADMPSGWSEEPKEDNDTPNSNVLCLEGDTTPNATGRATVDFKADTFGPYMSQIVNIYATVDDAKAEFAAYNSAVDQCQTWTETDEDGKESTYSMSRLSFDDYGDESFAARMDMGTGQADVIFIRKDNLVLSVAYITLAIAGPQDSIFQETVKKAWAKIE